MNHPTFAIMKAHDLETYIPLYYKSIFEWAIRCDEEWGNEHE